MAPGERLVREHSHSSAFVDGHDRDLSRGPHGVLVVDKPNGPTSHDIVALARRALGTRAVGHTGTLDPMATGVLALVTGEATKLARYLSGQDKEYTATIALGVETDTLDAQGKATRTCEPPAELSREAVVSAAKSFIGSYRQRPPDFSAIKRRGERMYRRARRNQEVETIEREVTVKELRVVETRKTEIDLIVLCSKGFYMRSLARDLAAALGTVGHLCALRRIRSGIFTLDGAIGEDVLQNAIKDTEIKSELLSKLISPADACGAMPSITLAVEGCRDAVCGRLITALRVKSGTIPRSETGPIALLDEGGKLIAVARVSGEGLRVERGFHY